MDPLERAKELESAPVAPTHAWIAENLVLEIDPHAVGFCAIESVVEDARRIGLRHVGRKREGTRHGKILVSDVFVEPTARAFVTVRNRNLDAIAAVGSKYFVISMLGDPLMIETCALAKPHLPSTARVQVRSGTENLEKDLASHLAAVGSRTTLPFRDHEDVVRSLRIYWRQCISAEIVQAVQRTSEIHAQMRAAGMKP